jgi:cell shape-determining protein MreC
MATNTNRIKIRPSGGGAFFTWLERALRMDVLFEDGIPVRFVPHVLFIAFLGVLYIANNHMADKNLREIDTLQQEVEELRADYTSLRSDHMFAVKQSEVAKKVKAMGLRESFNPPHKIVVRKGEY